MKKVFSILFVLVGLTASAQTPVRIPVCEFAELLETHPDVWSQKVAKLSDRSRESVYGSEEMIIAFKQNAFYTFQQCWILELQIKDVKNFEKSILAVKAEDRAMLEKQQNIVNETKFRLKELEEEYKVALSELQTYTRHKYGAQPVLPEGWLWENKNAMQSESLTVATTKLTDLDAMIALQEKFIGRVQGRDAYWTLDPDWTLNEVTRLNQYKQQRWESILQIVSLQSYKMAVGESVPHGHSMDTGAN